MVKNFIFVLDPKGKWNEATLEVKLIKESTNIFMTYATVNKYDFKEIENIEEGVEKFFKIMLDYGQEGVVKKILIDEKAGGGGLVWQDYLADYRINI